MLIVTGDHSTPSKLRSHSWHPVPALVVVAKTCRPDAVVEFGETYCLRGGSGPVPGDVLDVVGAGPRGAVGEIRGVRPLPGCIIGGPHDICRRDPWPFSRLA